MYMYVIIHLHVPVFYPLNGQLKDSLSSICFMITDCSQCTFALFNLVLINELKLIINI